MRKFSKKDVARSEFVWDNADRTDMYNDILNDLVISQENEYRAELIPPKNQEDYTKMVIGVNFIGKYIVELMEDIVSYIGKKHGWEESEDEIRRDIGLKAFTKYDKKYDGKKFIK